MCNKTFRTKYMSACFLVRLYFINVTDAIQHDAIFNVCVSEREIFLMERR